MLPWAKTSAGNHGIIERLVLEGILQIIYFQQPGTLCTRPLRKATANLALNTGMGHQQLLWAACSSASSPSQ